MLAITAVKSDYMKILSPYVDPAKIKIFCESDICGDMQHGSAFIAVTEESVTVVNGYFVISEDKRANKITRKNGHLSRGFSVCGDKTVAFGDIEELCVEELISTLRLMAKMKDGSYEMLAMGTFAAKLDFLLLVKYFDRLKKAPTEELTGDEVDFAPSLFCPKCGKRYPGALTKNCPKCMDKVGLLKKLWIFVKKYYVKLIILLAAYVVVSLLGVISPYFSSAFFYDEVLGVGSDVQGQFYGKVLLVVLIVAAVNIASLLVNMFSSIITARVSANLVFDLKSTIFESMKKLSIDFFTGKQTGALMTQINEDSNSINTFFINGIPYYIVNIIQFIAVAVIMLVLNWKLALICIAVLPLFFAMSSRVLQMDKYYHFRTHSTIRKFHSRLTDSLGAIKVTKAFARENEECNKFNRTTQNVADAVMQLTIFNNLAQPCMRMIMYLTRLFVWGLGGWMVIRGKMTYGFFTAFIAYADMLNSPLYSFAEMTDSLADCQNAVSRLFEIYDAEATIVEKDNPICIAPSEVKGKIEFDRVSFSYDKSRKIIDNVSFTVPAGKKLGIVGHSGAGKSTLANLLIRLYDTDEGEIRLDGVSIKDLSFKTLRDNIAIVSQETYLFRGTIYDNIAYAKPEATRAEIIEAARMAGAHEFIVKLPDGYQTKVGSGNKSLSGGEKQRISIARAILKKPKILILDEATASMDTKTERMIQMSLDELAKDRTTISIAHRLSTLKNVDNLVVIEGGKLVQEGTHRELMAEEGIYRNLYNLQLAALKNVIKEENNNGDEPENGGFPGGPGGPRFGGHGPRP